MTNEIELRAALQANADAIEVPEGLAARTMDAAKAADAPSRLERWRTKRVATVRTGPPRWAYAGAVAAAFIGLFAIGQGFTGGPQLATGGGDTDSAGPAERSAKLAGDEVRDGGGDMGEMAVGAAPPPESMSSEDMAVSGAGGGSVGRSVVPPGNPGAFPPKVIEEANLEVEVKEGSFDAAWAKANEIASKHGGFVTNSSTELIEDKFASGSLVIRVPSEKLDVALRDFRELGKVVRMSSSGTDVAGQFVDLDARIRSAKAEETQLLELMRQARTLSDTLEIRGRLTAVREEIEQLTSQKQFLQSQVDFATLHATIYEPQAKPEDFGPGRFDDAFGKAFDVAQAIFAGTILVLGVLVPLAIIGAVVWGGWTLLRRRRAV